MSTLTVYTVSTDGAVQSTDNAYATARSGAGFDHGAGMNVGQYYTGGPYNCLEGFVSFDTSSLTALAVISAATISLAWQALSNTTDYVIEARTQNWGGTLANSDWVAGASLSGLTLLGSKSTAGQSTDTYFDLTNNGNNLINAISLTGKTYILLDSDHLASGTAPTTLEYGTVENSTQAHPARLVVTYGYPPAPRALGAMQAVQRAATR